MPFVDQTDNVTALVTDLGRENLARSVLGELSFQLSSFQVGRGGYVDINPVKADTIDTSLTSLIDPVPTPLDRRSFVSIEQPIGPNVAAPVCRLDAGDTTISFGLGELGVWATILRNDPDPGSVGTDFLFAVAHFPLMCKALDHTLVWRVIIAL